MGEARVSKQSQDETEQQPNIGRIPALIAAVAIVGIAIGAAAGLLTLMLYQVERFALGYIENAHESGPFNMPAIRRAISVTVGASIAAVIWWLLRTRTTTVPSVKKAVGGALMPVWQTIVHVLLQIFIVGTGMSIGREVAPRELGAMFGQRFARWVRLGAKDTRMLVAITAAAGLAGVYNAPLAGTFFAVEILLADVTLETVTLAFACSALASWVASLVKGTHTFYLIGKANGLFTPDYMVFALIAGLMLGVAGALFRRGSQWAEKNKPSGAGILWMMPLAGLLTGVVAIVVPQVMGNGRATAQLSFSSKADLAVLPILLLSFEGDCHLADDSFRRFRWRAAAGHRIGRFRRCDSGHSLDAGVPHEFDWHVCAAGCMRAARRLAAGAVDGDLPGDGVGRRSDQSALRWPSARSPPPVWPSRLPLGIYRGRKLQIVSLRIAGSQSSHGRHPHMAIRPVWRGSSTVSTNQWSLVRIVTSPPYCCAMCRIDFTPKPCRCWSSRFVVRRLPSASFFSRES